MNNYVRSLLIVVAIASLVWTQGGKFLAKYKVGQVWSYNARDVERDSLVEIVDIQVRSGFEVIYSIHINGSKIESPYLKNWFPGEEPFYYVSENALNKSVVTLQNDREISGEVLNNYMIFKKDYSELQGIHTDEVSNMQKMLAKTLQ